MCTVYWYKNHSIINELFNFKQIRWYRKAGIPKKWYGARRTSRTGCAAPVIEICSKLGREGNINIINYTFVVINLLLELIFIINCFVQLIN